MRQGLIAPAFYLALMQGVINAVINKEEVLVVE